MVRNFAYDIGKVTVGKYWLYNFTRRHKDKVSCEWFDGFDVARKQANNTPRYKAYFDLVS